LQRQVHRDGAFFLPGKGIVKIVMSDDQSAVDVTILEGSLGKAGVILLHERRQERIAGRNRIDAG
jgi:hypothetical protein